MSERMTHFQTLSGFSVCVHKSITAKSLDSNIANKQAGFGRVLLETPLFGAFPERDAVVKLVGRGKKATQVVSVLL